MRKGRKGPKGRKERACRRCGCTQMRITERCEAAGGCGWAEEDLCTTCLTPAEAKRLQQYPGALCSDRNYVPQIIAALQLQIDSVRDGLGTPGTEYGLEPKYAAEVECLEEAIAMVRAEPMRDDYRKRQTPGLCSQCFHLDRCKWLVGAKAHWAECDFWPRRFLRRPRKGAER